MSISPLGLMVIAVCVISGFAGVNLTSSYLYRIFALSLSLIIIALISRNRNFSDLKVKLFFSKQFPVGENSKYLLKIFNDGTKDLYDVSVILAIENTIPTLEQFESIKEPKEDKRNIWDRNIYAYRWMWHLIRSFNAEFEAVNVKLVEAHSFAIEKPSFNPVKRGKISINGAYLVKKDIFGLFNTSKFLGLDEIITILPRRYDIDKKVVNIIKADLELTKNSLFNIMHKHKTGDFVGLRQYVPGDPIRNIHWKSWAKTEKPMVIEKGFGKINEFNIVLFNMIRSESEGFALKFEDALSFTYSLLEYFSKNWFTVNFYYFLNRELKLLTFTNDKGNFPKLYDAICQMQYYVYPEIENTVNQLSKKLKKHSNSFFILPDDDKGLINFANTFKPIIAINSDEDIIKRRTINIPKVNKQVEQITIT